MDKELTDNDISREGLSKAEIAQVLTDLAAVGNIDTFFKAMIYEDLTAFFNVPKENQDMVRGMLMRTRHLLKQIRDVRKPNREKAPYENPRHK